MLSTQRPWTICQIWSGFCSCTLAATLALVAWSCSMDSEMVAQTNTRWHGAHTCIFTTWWSYCPPFHSDNWKIEEKTSQSQSNGNVHYSSLSPLCAHEVCKAQRVAKCFSGGGKPASSFLMHFPFHHCFVQFISVLPFLCFKRIVLLVRNRAFRQICCSRRLLNKSWLPNLPWHGTVLLGAPKLDLMKVHWHDFCANVYWTAFVWGSSVDSSSFLVFQNSPTNAEKMKHFCSGFLRQFSRAPEAGIQLKQRRRYQSACWSLMWPLSTNLEPVHTMPQQAKIITWYYRIQDYARRRKLTQRKNTQQTR